MSKVKYIAGDSGADEVRAFGYDFKDGKATEVKDADAAKFDGNPFFSVSAKAEKADAKTDAKTDTKTDDDDTALKAVHIAGGRYSIKRGDEELKKGLTKADAEAFNEMSDEDKAEYVAA